MSSVQSLCHISLFVTLWIAVHQAPLSITNSQGQLKLMYIESVMPSSHLIICHSLLFPPSIFPSIRVFYSESVLHIRWPKDWSFSFSMSPSNEYLGMIFFRIDWLDLLVVQRTLKSSPAPQFEIIISLVLSLLYGPTLTSIHDHWKNHSFDQWTFVGKVMSLLFNMLSRLVIALLTRSKCPLISWLQSSSAVVLETKMTDYVTVSIVYPSIFNEEKGPEDMILVF